MPDIHSIIVQIKPDVDQGMARVDSRLAQAEAKGKAAGEAIGEAFERAAQEALAAVEKSAAAQERAAAQAAKAAAKAAKEQAAAARQAAKEIDETARATIIAAERRARERSAAEREAAKQTAAAARQAAAAKETADRQAAAAAKAAADAQKQAQAKMRDAYREIIGPAADYNRKLQEAIALERQGAITANQRALYVKRLQGEMRSFNPGGGGGGGGIGGLLQTQLGGQLAGIASVGAVVGLAKGALDLSDSYASLTSRLITLTNSESAAIPLREKLLQIAEDTKTANSSIVELYARIAGAVKELGVSEGRTLEFTDRLTKAFKVSGASTIAQQQAMIQLAQGLGAGALRGEEFNSVLEAAPNIIDIVGQHIGKTRGEMRAMAEAGKLTTKTILDAFEAAGPQIDAKFGKRIVTVGEQWVGFRNKVEVAVGQISESVGATGAAASAFDVLNKAVADAAYVLQGAITTWQEWNNLTGGLQGAVAKAALAPGPALRFVGAMKDLNNLLGNGTSLGDAVYTQTLVAHNQAIEAGTAAMVARHEAIQQALRDYREGIGVLDEFGRAFQRGDTGLEAEDAYAAFLAKRNAEARRARILAGKPAPERILPGGFVIPGDNPNRIEQREALDAARERTIQAQERARAAAKQLRDAYDQVAASASSTATAEAELAKIRDTLDRATRAGLVSAKEANEIYETRRERLRDQLEPFAAAIRKIEEETAALGLSADARKRSIDLRSIENGLRAQGVKLTAEEILQLELALDKQEAAAIAAKEQEKQIANQRAVYEQVYGPGIRYREMLEALRAEYDRGALSSERYAFEVRKLQDQYNQTSGGASLTEGFQQQAQKVAQQNQEALDGLVQGLTDVAGGFFNLSEQAHKSFGQMAADAAAAAAKILVEFAILQGLRAVFGGDSGVASVASQIFFGGNRAAGGTFVAPNGGGGGVDSVPVLFRTTPGEHITFTPPGQAPPGHAPPQVVVPVSVNNGISHDMIAAALDTPAGHTAVFNVIERYVDQIASRVRASS